MRRALGMMELIVVLVIMAILAGVGFYAFKPNYLRNDADFLLMKILEAKYEGIQYDKRLAEENLALGCIDLQKSGIENMAERERYRFRSEIDQDFGILCFDRLGRPHEDDNTTANAPLDSVTELVRLRYGTKSATLSVFPQSGYVIITYQ